MIQIMTRMKSTASILYKHIPITQNFLSRHTLDDMYMACTDKPHSPANLTGTKSHYRNLITIQE